MLNSVRATGINYFVICPAAYIGQFISTVLPVTQIRVYHRGHLWDKNLFGVFYSNIFEFIYSLIFIAHKFQKFPSADWDLLTGLSQKCLCKRRIYRPVDNLILLPMFFDTSAPQTNWDIMPQTLQQTQNSTNFASFHSRINQQQPIQRLPAHFQKNQRSARRYSSGTPTNLQNDYSIQPTHSVNGGVRKGGNKVG